GRRTPRLRACRRPDSHGSPLRQRGRAPRHRGDREPSRPGWHRPRVDLRGDSRGGGRLAGAGDVARRVGGSLRGPRVVAAAPARPRPRHRPGARRSVTSRIHDPRARALQGKRAGVVSRGVATLVDAGVVFVVYLALLLVYGVVRFLVARHSVELARPDPALTGAIAVLVVPTGSIASGSPSVNKQLSHLDALEAESIHIFREVAAEFEKPVLLFSGGKDSIVMLRLAEKAFWPARIPFAVMHVDT